jgi:ATP-dependent DNA ligase
VLGPDGLSRFEELSRRDAARTAILYAFDLIEHDGEDLRDRPFLDRKAALARLAGVTLRASCRRRSMGHIDPVLVRSGSRSAIRPASRYSESGARFGIDEPQAALTSGKAGLPLDCQAKP